MVPPYRPPEDRTRRGRSGVRALMLVSAVVAAGAGATVWSMRGPDSYGDAASRCVHVALPSSTGGFIIDRCGEAAKAWCAAQTSSTGMLADRSRPACLAAGFQYGGSAPPGG